MKRLAAILWAALLVTGCASTGGYAVIEQRGGVPRRANLALGPTRGHAQVAQEFAARRDWPAAVLGFRGEDITVNTTITYDQQSYNDRYNSYYRETQSVRTGTWMR
ncbi:MAG: hypothetical protein AB1601_08120 [Planctomycetota bacterium]